MYRRHKDSVNDVTHRLLLVYYSQVQINEVPQAQAGLEPHWKYTLLASIRDPKAADGGLAKQICPVRKGGNRSNEAACRDGVSSVFHKIQTLWKYEYYSFKVVLLGFKFKIMFIQQNSSSTTKYRSVGKYLSLGLKVRVWEGLTIIR